MSALPPIVSFVAPSGTGKTTFLERLLPVLRDRGLRVLVVKHDVHRFEVDREGKDTWRFRAAGAHRVLIANRSKFALMGEVDGEVPLRTFVERYGPDVDLVVTEGYRSSAMPKILVAREAATPRRPWAEGTLESIEPLVAVVADHAVALPERHASARRLPLEDPGPCADLIEALIATQRAERQVSAVLLAGGRGVRMGMDKAQLAFRGRPLLPQLAERLQGCTSRVLVVKREGQELPPLPADVDVVTDLLPALGPLGGLLTGLAAAPTPFVFLGACDLPLLDPSWVRWLARHPARGADVLLPIRDGHPEPTHALYSARCLGFIKRAVLSGELGMGSWLGSVRVARIQEDEWGAERDARSFVNVNTPEDLAAAEALAD